jgi:hypothetical protein
VKTWWGALAIAATTSGVAQGQVGYPPAESPFRDLAYKQEATIVMGYFAAGADPVGVAPQSGPMLGARYEVRVGGPAQFAVRVARVFSERNVLDPTKPVDERIVSTDSWPLYLADLGLTFNLTGQKSFRGLVPVASFGGGVATDLKGSEDVGGFKFGTAFALSFGAGIRWVPGSAFQLRLDVLDYLYQVRYPNSYFTSSGSLPAVRSGSQSAWTHNAAITLGGSYQFFR